MVILRQYIYKPRTTTTPMFDAVCRLVDRKQPQVAAGIENASGIGGRMRVCPANGVSRPSRQPVWLAESARDDRGESRRVM